MKSTVALTTQRIVLSLAIALVVAAPAIAKENGWKLDADHFDGSDLAGRERVQHRRRSSEWKSRTGPCPADEFDT